MNEFAWLTQFKNEPVTLLVFVIIVGSYKAVEALVKYVFPLVFKKKTCAGDETCPESLQARHEKQLKKIEDLLNEDRADRLKRQAETDKVTRDVLLKSCVAVMYNPNAPALERFLAAITYFKNHGNGNGQECVIRIILQDKQVNFTLWKSALNEDMKHNGPSDDRYFLSAIKNINKQINGR